jgi:chemotaxis response regulator CheB
VPLTLAIVPAFIVRSAAKCFAIPQVNLVELVRLESGQAGIEMVHGASVYRLRGLLLPLVHLNRELRLVPAESPTSNPNFAPLNIVVLQVDNRRFGLVVDEVHDAEDIVVKPLSRHLKGIRAYAGATILGDGKLALILDVLGIAAGAGITADAHEAGAKKEAAEAQVCASNSQKFVLFCGAGNSRMALPLNTLARELITKIVALRPFSTPPAPKPAAAPAVGRPISRRIDIVAIGTSTGGPNALAEVVPRLPGDFPVPVVIVQHMPPLFTRLLAEHLGARASLIVEEAQTGVTLLPGHVWIAPGDYHMCVVREGEIHRLSLSQDSPEHSCRPAVDVLFRSVARTFGPHALAVVLTGMGCDGTLGSKAIRQAGGEVLIQDHASSVVWGMPGSVASAGLADYTYALGAMVAEITRRVVARRSVSVPAAKPVQPTYTTRPATRSEPGSNR